MSDADHVPSWVPEIAPGVRADVYPVEPPRQTREPYCDSPPELVLDRHAVTAGYSERRLPYEFASCLPAAVTAVPAPPLASAVPGSQPASAAFNPSSGNGLSATDLSKLRTGIAQLRRSRPTKLQRVEQQVFTPPKPAPPAESSGNEETASFVSKKAFPLQKPSGSNSLEDWFNKLSSGANFNTSELSRSVPLGPAIVRAAGKVIEMMATRSVPTQRAAWYIRIAVLNECVKQIRPDRPAPFPRTFWTRQLCNLLKTDIEAIRARKTAMLGPMDRVPFWDYVLDLARWQADEGLLDCSQWMTKICVLLRQELITSQSFNSPGTKITIGAARRFLAEFLSSPASARQLLEALIPGANSIVKAWRSTPSANAAKSDPAGGNHVHGKGNAKAGARRGSVKRPQFTPNLCHREVTMLLSALVRFLDDSVPSTTESETRMSDLERFVKRGVGIIRKNRSQENGEANKTTTRGAPGLAATIAKDAVREQPPTNHDVMRALEMLPGHGDVPRVTMTLLKSFEERGGIRAAVKHACEWALEGPSSDRDESICIAAAVVAYLGRTRGQFARNGSTNLVRRMNQDIHKPSSGLVDPTWSPPLQREVWNFLKDYASERKPTNLDEDATVVRFITHACRIEVLSLRALVRDISRLASQGHSGTAYLVKCLSLLPGPVEQQLSQDDSTSTASLDCRRPLLRKYGYLPSSRLKQESQFNDEYARGALSGDMATMKVEAEALRETCDTNAILSTTEYVRLHGLWSNSIDATEVTNKLFSISSFLVRLDGPGPAVEWLLGNWIEVLDGTGRLPSSTSVDKKNVIMSEIIRLAENSSRYLAANGLLEHSFELLKRAWLNTWVSSFTRRRILQSAAAFAKAFANEAATGLYWTRLAARSLRLKVEGASASKLLPFATASMRGIAESSGVPERSMNDVFTAARKEVFSSPDEDLPQLATMAELHSVSLDKVRSDFKDSEGGFSLDELFARGFTGNDIFGTVLIPVLVATIGEPFEETGEDSLFCKLAVSALHVVADREHDIRLQGVRPTLLIEFIAVLATGCLSAHKDAISLLEVLVQTTWFWKMIAPKAGTGLAKRLRSRVDFYCEKVGAIDTMVVSALLFNMAARFSGDEDEREVTVPGALGADPFGIIDMKLALLATHSHESGEDEDLGSRICETAVALVSVDSARSLACSVLRSCFSDEGRQIVAGLVGYGAVQAMAESLGFVVKGLTVEAPKNSLLHQERAMEWYQADSARRIILECIVDSLNQEVGVQVEAVLFDQLATATKLLTIARARNCMPSSLLEDGGRISDALESRLTCILKSQRTPQSAEVWTQRTTEIATLMQCAVPLMKQPAVTAGTETIILCLKNLGECDSKSEEPAPGTATKSMTPSQILDTCDDGSLREHLQELLRPVLPWVDERERKTLTSITEKTVGAVAQKANLIQARNSEGLEIDNWMLLEGYGRGPDEEAAIPPAAFGRQGGIGTVKVEFEPVIQLKRTYSTFSSLAV